MDVDYDGLVATIDQYIIEKKQKRVDVISGE